MKGLDENLSELVVLPSIDDDIDTGVKNKEQVGDVGKDRAPETQEHSYEIMKKGTWDLNYFKIAKLSPSPSQLQLQLGLSLALFPY